MPDGSSGTRNRCALRRSWASSAAAGLCVAAALAACDERFEPIAPTALAFSVFGYLDASADTQWLRVMPIRPLRVTSPDALEAHVTLEQLETGRLIALRDSVFRFTSPWDSALGAEGAYVHNFWTREEIEPGAAYRFSASREGTEPAEAVVEIPRDYEVEVAVDQVWWAPDELRITGVKHLPFVATITHFYDDCGLSATSTRYPGRSADDEAYLIAIQKPQVIARMDCGTPVAQNSEIWIVGSEVTWPAGGYTLGALGESSRTSNVTNAVGFLGGVLTKLLPYDDCQFSSDGAPVPRYCPLRYDGGTATVRGTVRERGCGGGPIESALVQLTETGRDPARIRTAFTTRAGEFVIGALESGIPHVLQAGARPYYSPHTDTLMFMPGQRLEYDVHLEPVTPCGQVLAPGR
jgi:hypothetical protein